MKALMLALLLLPQDSDARKSAQQLYTEGQRFESVDRDFSKAADKYRKAAEKASSGDAKPLAAQSLAGLARCCESSEPENLSDALKAYEDIVSKYGDVEPIASLARKKIEWQGVDVILRQYRNAVDRWRSDKQAPPLRTTRETFWSKIKKLDVKAVPGLLEGLGEQDEVVREFAADCLARVVAGVEPLTLKLKDPNPVVRGGASLALERVFQIWREAKALDDQADHTLRDFGLSKVGLAEGMELDAEINRGQAAAAEAEALRKELERNPESGDPGKRLRLAELQNTALRGKMLQNVKNTHDLVKQLKTRAAELRNHLPEELNTAEAQQALADLIADEKADPTARLEGAKAALSIGAIAGTLTDALVAGMNSKDRNVRIGSASAAAAVATEKGEDKHKLADQLMAIVQYEPERDWSPAELTAADGPAVESLVAKLSSDKDDEADAATRDLIQLGDKVESVVRRAAAQAKGEKIRGRFEILLGDLQARRWANDALVRQSAALALGQIGLAKSIPALIEALEDNDGSVRREAGNALVVLTGISKDYDPNPHVADPEHKMGAASKSAAQLAIRAKGVEEWKKWWNETRGVAVLVDRFWSFQAAWTTYSAADLFDEDFLKRKTVGLAPDRDEQWKTAREKRVFDEFSSRKEVYVMDAVDLGPEVLDKLLERLGGQSDFERVYEKLGDKQKSDQTAKSRAATRLFVATAVARLATQVGPAGIIPQLTGLLQGDKAAGAAHALGMLDKAALDEKAAEALEMYGLGSADPVVQEAVATALAKVGAASSAKGLTDLAASASQEKEADSPRVRAAVAAIRAIGALRLKNETTVKTLCDLIDDEPRAERAAQKAFVDVLREYACEALGYLGDPNAIEALSRARRDTRENVRIAAAHAVRGLFKVDATVSQRLLQIVNNEKEKSLHRIGAALAVGDTAHEARVHELVARLVSQNPPRDVRDFDPAVRAAVCGALGAIRSRTQLAIGNLIEALSDPAEEVRRQAYAALHATLEGEYDGGFEEQEWKKFAEIWKIWYEGKKEGFKKAPDKDT